MRFAIAATIALCAIMLVCPLDIEANRLDLSNFLGYDLPVYDDGPAPFMNRNGYDDYKSDDYYDDEDELAKDVAVKLKKEYADDLVSELFALSHGLVRVARVTELTDDSDNHGEHLWFHFKMSDLPYDENLDESNDRHRHHRVKRHVENKIDLLRADDRVEYVLPQRMLKREKRGLIPSLYDDYLLNKRQELAKRKLYTLLDDAVDEQATSDEETIDYSDLDYLKENLYNILRDNSIKIEDRKKIYDLFRHDNDDDVNEKDGMRNSNNKQSKQMKFGSSLPPELKFNDKNYKKEWYLINNGQFNTPPSTHDLNVKEAWLRGYTGKNKTIVIVDDGLDYEHPDFEGKYRPDLSYDYNDENDTKHDPMPSTFDDQNNHGTRCAGAAAANANNSVCGVGIAYDAQIAGIRILDGPITDLLEARALSYKANQVDIRSASWGPKDDGAHMEYPGKFVNLALEEGVKRGRNGKGTLYVWATGNGGGNDDDCSCDGYVSHWDIISIGSVNHRGLTPYFMELCPSTMAVVYSGGQTKVSGDDDDPGVRVVASDVRGKCTTKFQGTSSAAPLAAGAFALVLEANGNLTYRDVMHLIARTSRIPNKEDISGWIINGANYHVNEKYGFGVLDVSKMIHEALDWVNVPPREKCIVKYNGELPSLGANDKIQIDLVVNENDCPNVQVLEHTVANISFSFTTRGDIKLTLISPSHTPSEILSYRKNDRSGRGTKHFPFMSVFNWGESPIGTWKLIIETRTRPGKEPNYGSLDEFSLTLFGSRQWNDKSSIPTEGLPSSKRYASSHLLSENGEASVPSFDDLAGIYDSELKVAREVRLVDKRMKADGITGKTN